MSGKRAYDFVLKAEKFAYADNFLRTVGLKAEIDMDLDRKGKARKDLNFEGREASRGLTQSILSTNLFNWYAGLTEKEQGNVRTGCREALH